MIRFPFRSLSPRTAGSATDPGTAFRPARPPRRPALAPALALLLLAAGPAPAHPHVFIRTALELRVDAAGQLAAIAVTWSYDEMYSMLLLDDQELDPDYDGVLTEAELDRLEGYDLNWIEGFEGDLYVTAPGGAAVELGPPESLGVAFEDGVYTSRHLRPLVRPRPADGLVVKAYDPGFYTAYDLGGGVTVTGADCTATITPPETDDAYEALAAEMADLPPEAEDYPQVGETFADTIRLHCEETP